MAQRLYLSSRLDPRVCPVQHVNYDAGVHDGVGEIHEGRDQNWALTLPSKSCGPVSLRSYRHTQVL